MKRLSYFLIVLLVFITGCTIKSKDTKDEIDITTDTPTFSSTAQTLAPEIKYYTLTDFDFVTIEETTIQDIIKFAPNEFYHNSSLGLFSQYPTEDGQYIVIVYSGGVVVKDIFVSNIDRIDGLKAIQIKEKTD